MIVKLYIGNDKLDLFKDENIVVTSTITDTQDISKNTGDYSKTFTVPATSTNNIIFKHYYDADIDNTFDARTKVDGRIELDGLPFRVGKWRLSKVKTKSGNPSSYTINFFGRLVSLKNKFKKDELSTLDLSAFDHQYNYDEVKQGLQTSLFSDSIKYHLITKKRYYYNSDPTDSTDSAAISNIAFNGQTIGVRYTDLQPAIKVIDIIEALEIEYEISFSRDFFGRVEFDSIYMWVNNDGDEDSIVKIEEFIDFSIANGGTGSYANINGTTGIGSFNTYNGGFSGGRNRWSNTMRIIPETGFEDVEYDVVSYVNGVEYMVDSGTGQQDFGAGSLFSEIDGLFNEDDWEVYFSIRAPLGFSYTARWTQVEFVTGSPFTSYQTFLPTVQTIDGDISISQNLPKIKIIDFLKGLFSMFKLVVIPLDDTNVYVNTIEDYYSQGRLVDVTNYVDFDSVDVKRGDILNDIKFNFSEPQTILGVAFEDNTGIAYGDEELLLSDEDGEPLDGTALTVKLPFESMVYERLTDVFNSVQTNVMYGAVIDEELEAVNIKPHLFYSVSQDLGTETIGWFDTASSVVELTGNINTASHSIDFLEKPFVLNFGSEFSNWDGVLMTKNLYTNYYKSYIDSIFNIKRRNWVFQCVLPLNILASLELNDIIQIKERHYRIDSFDLNLTTGESTLNLINSFDNTIDPFTSGNTIYFIDSNDRLLSNYIKGNDSYVSNVSDAGYGIDWITLSYDDRITYMQVDENTTGSMRVGHVLVSNTAGKGTEIEIIINQDAGNVTADMTTITADSTIITADKI